MSKDELLKLAERVESGDGIDRALRHAVITALDLTFSEGREILTSIDAVEALRERLLPGWLIEARQYEEHCIAGIFEPYDPASYRRLWTAKASTEPRSRLAALLRAYAGGLQG